jgi:aryl-alcohol dehydrogenase-like predicted oxidoreductase
MQTTSSATAGPAPASLGFGCASLRVDRPRQALAALACAYEHGIRHFDTARMYGYGENERLLGEFLRDKRAQVTITTKFGLEPRPYTRKELLKEQARRALGRLPRLRAALRRLRPAAAPVASTAPVPPRFAPEQARRSLETSLRLLRVERIDYWLLHEAAAVEASDEALLRFLERMRADGKIGAFGIGTHTPVLLPEQDRYPAACQVFQFDNHLLNRAGERFHRAAALRITHSAMAPLPQLRQRIAGGGIDTAAFRADTGLDLASAEDLAALLLRWACLHNPGGMVLFASNTPKHIQRNAGLHQDPRLGADTVARFAALLRG